MTIIRGQSFTTPQMYEGHNPLVILENEFTGTYANEWALGIRNCSNVYIGHNKFHDLQTAGIVLRSTGSNTGVKIEHNEIWNTKGSGIRSERQNNKDVEITRNIIRNAGESDRTHAIYVQSPDVLVGWNYIYGTGGNGISIRSSGRLLENYINGAMKSCIRYFSDHEKGPSDKLSVIRNVCVGGGVDYPAISMLFSTEVRADSPDPLKRLLAIYEFTENVMFSKTETFRVQSPQFAGKSTGLKNNISYGKLIKDFVTFDEGNIEFGPVII